MQNDGENLWTMKENFRGNVSSTSIVTIYEADFAIFCVIT